MFSLCSALVDTYKDDFDEEVQKENGFVKVKNFSQVLFGKLDQLKSD